MWGWCSDIEGVVGWKRERPYQLDSTASRLLSEVKQVRAWLVLRWGTTLESQVLFSFAFFNPCFGLSLSYLLLGEWLLIVFGSWLVLWWGAMLGCVTPNGHNFWSMGRRELLQVAKIGFLEPAARIWAYLASINSLFPLPFFPFCVGWVVTLDWLMHSGYFQLVVLEMCTWSERHLVLSAWHET